MNFAGWTVWALGCFVLLTQVPHLSNSDGGIRSLARGFMLFVIAGLAATFFTDLSKLHLLWWIPLTFALNMMVFGWVAKNRMQEYLRRTQLDRDNEVVEVHAPETAGQVKIKYGCAFLSVERANEIVDGISNVLTSPKSRPGNFTPISLTGAASRTELANAIYIVTAETFRAFKRQNADTGADSDFAKFARGAGGSFFHVLMACPFLPDDELRVITGLPKDSKEFHEERSRLRELAMNDGTQKLEVVDSFIAFLRTLDPLCDDYWPKVYQRIGNPEAGRRLAPAARLEHGPDLERIAAPYEAVPAVNVVEVSPFEKVDPADVRYMTNLDSAAKDFSSCYREIMSYSLQAIKRQKLRREARRQQRFVNGDEEGLTTEAPEIAALQEAELPPLTADYLNDYTITMNAFMAAFRRLSTAFHAVLDGAAIHAEFIDKYRLACSRARVVADAYLSDAVGAQLDAMRGIVQAAKAGFDNGARDQVAGNAEAPIRPIESDNAMEFMRVKEKGLVLKELRHAGQMAERSAEEFLEWVKLEVVWTEELKGLIKATVP